MTLQEQRTRVILRRLKLILVEAIFEISDHERRCETRNTRRADDRLVISTLFRLRFELQDMLLQVHLIEDIALRHPVTGTEALVAAATSAAQAQLPVIRSPQTASPGAKQLASIVLGLRADLEARRDRLPCDEATDSVEGTENIDGNG